ncbi:AMP-binding protein [Streptomyces sp. NPDC059866]|uniref:AMP-binding protein n=1 Tax=Streptomyces sp. NPDC059866 TaxID=3346978 RepID=UPI00364AA9CB
MARRSVGYPGLERRTAWFAGHLARLGVRRGDRVALHRGNRVELVESCPGVLRAGAVGVPLDQQATDAELAYFLDDSGAVAIVTEADALPRIARLTALRRGLRIVVVGADAAHAGAVGFEELAGTDPGLPPRDDLGLDEPAWILCTSGTTGERKGVLSSQRTALWSVTAAYVPLWGLEQRDRLLWPLPMHHCYAHSLCLLGVVSVGAGAYLLERGASTAEALTRPPGGQPFTVVAGAPARVVARENAVSGRDSSGRARSSAAVRRAWSPSAFGLAPDGSNGGTARAGSPPEPGGTSASSTTTCALVPLIPKADTPPPGATPVRVSAAARNRTTGPPGVTARPRAECGAACRAAWRGRT